MCEKHCDTCTCYENGNSDVSYVSGYPIKRNTVKLYVDDVLIVGEWSMVSNIDEHNKPGAIRIFCGSENWPADAVFISYENGCEVYRAYTSEKAMARCKHDA